MYAIHAVDAAITASFDLKVTLSVILRQMINPKARMLPTS